MKNITQYINENAVNENSTKYYIVYNFPGEAPRGNCFNTEEDFDTAIQDITAGGRNRKPIKYSGTDSAKYDALPKSRKQTNENAVNESKLEFNEATIQLAILYLETKTNTTLNRNFKWLVDELLVKIDDKSSKNKNVELTQQQYDFVKRYSALGHKEFSKLNTD